MGGPSEAAGVKGRVPRRVGRGADWPTGVLPPGQNGGPMAMLRGGVVLHGTTRVTKKRPPCYCPTCDEEQATRGPRKSAYRNVALMSTANAVRHGVLTFLHRRSTLSPVVGSRRFLPTLPRLRTHRGAGVPPLVYMPYQAARSGRGRLRRYWRTGSLMRFWQRVGSQNCSSTSGASTPGYTIGGTFANGR